MRRTPIKRKTPLKRSGKRLAKSRKDTIGKLKKKLWSLCREIIISRNGSDCYTCPARDLVGSNRHLGHFISSSVCSVSLRYDLENLRPQCYRCNIHLSGNWPSFERHLRLDGIDVEALKQRNYDTKHLMYDRLWYEAKIFEYTKLLDSSFV